MIALGDEVLFNGNAGITAMKYIGSKNIRVKNHSSIC